MSMTAKPSEPINHENLKRYMLSVGKNTAIKNTIISLLKTRFIYTVDVSDNVGMFEHEVLSKYFKNLPVARCLQNRGYRIRQYMSTTVKTIDVCIYKGTPIVLEMGPDILEKNHIKMHFHTLQDKTSKIILNKFCSMLIRCSERYHAVVTGKNINIFSAPNDKLIKRIPPRMFDTVFIEDSVMGSLSNCINSFCNKRDWYREKCIPYHLGIILYGPPGTGKSTLIQPISRMLNCRDVYVYNADRLDYFSGFIRDITDDIAYRYENGNITTIVIEDIDCSKLATSRESSDVSDERGSKRHVSLASILNCIDGLNAPDGVVYIFTTNNIDALDPALIRPGRIDLKLNIGYLTNETLDKFIMFHYGRHLPEGFEIRDELTCAKLQIDVLRGCTYEEMIDICSKGE